jgi:hypothetical protein
MKELTEMERLKIENCNLRILYMQQQIQQVQAERTAFLHQLEAANPGYRWSDMYGRLLEENDEEILEGVESAHR